MAKTAATKLTAYAKKLSAMEARAKRFDAETVDREALVAMQQDAPTPVHAAYVGKLVAYYMGKITEAQRPKGIGSDEAKEIRASVEAAMGQPSASRVGTVRVMNVADLLG